MSYHDNSARILELMNQISDVRYSDLELERECCEKLLEIGKRSEDLYAVCYAHTYLGDYHYASGNFIESEQHLIKAREYCALFDFQDLLLVNHMFSGHLFRRIGNEQRALDYYLDGVALADQQGNKSLASTLYNSIAVIFHTLQDYTEAMKCLETAYELQEEIDSDDTKLRRHINLLSNLSEVAGQIGMHEKAKSYLQEAEELIRHSNLDIMEFGIIYIAKVCCVKEDHPEELQAVLNELFSLQPETWLDKSLVFDMLTSIAHRLLLIKEYTCLQQVLDTLTTACKGTEYEHSLTLHSFHIKLWRESHKKGEETGIYEDFYEAFIYGDVISLEVRTAGLMARMNLRRTMQEKELTQARNKALEEVAYHDELTQTYNRRYFSDFLEKFRHINIQRRVCVAMVDLDYFKEFNDSYGHIEGDNALRVVARCLRDNATGETFIVRYGGDEFAVFGFDMTDDEVEDYFYRVRSNLSGLAIEHINSRCPSKIVSLSIGYCNADVQTTAEFEVLLSNADKALYMSKYQGRDTISRFG